MQHIWDFSHVTLQQDERGKLRLEGRLDPVFTDDTRLSQAAGLVTAMLPLARELHGSNRRLGLASEELDSVKAGTVEAALKNLIAYRNQLENRLAMRFMEACGREVRRPPVTRSWLAVCRFCAALRCVYVRSMQPLSLVRLTSPWLCTHRFGTESASYHPRVRIP